MSKIIYVVRQDKQYHEHGTISNLFSNIYPIKKIICEWDNIFNISWHQFRYLLNELREQNAKDLKFDAQYYSYELTSVDLDDCIVIPIDDDDWLHPDLFSILKELPKCDHYRWNYTDMHLDKSHTHNEFVTHKECEYYCMPNNYALHSPKNITLIEGHCEASKFYQSDKEPIDKCLSVHLLHPSSVSFLSEHFCNGLLNLLDVYKKPPIIHDDVPSYFLKYIEKLTKIYKKLSPRRLFL